MGKLTLNGIHVSNSKKPTQRTVMNKLNKFHDSCFELALFSSKHHKDHVLIQNNYSKSKKEFLEIIKILINS